MILAYNDREIDMTIVDKTYVIAEGDREGDL
jgi:hypothetical protein